MSEVRNLIKILDKHKDPEVLQGMKRFGITGTKALGIKIPVLRTIARPYQGDHQLALQLWVSGMHEARLLATFIDKPKFVTQHQMDTWVAELDSWDICDQCCSNLFCRTPFAVEKALEWSKQEPEFVKRAGFVMMATMAVHCKIEPDDTFLQFLEEIYKQSYDQRNFVKKAVNWALRQIGKRNVTLHHYAINTATAVSQQLLPSSRWIATDALRELTNPNTVARIENKANRKMTR